MHASPQFRAVALAGLMAALFAAGQANAAVTYAYDASSPVNVPGIATFKTDGAMMAGMSVTATFSTGLSETLFWSPTGIGSGGVTGTGWSLGLTGDSYSNDWNFSFLQASAPLTLKSLVLDGAPGFTVFDLWLDGDTGTPNSEAGRDFEFLPASYNVTATYSKPVGVAGDPPYDSELSSPLPPHDLWQVLTVDFGANGIGENFSFRQDTDNDTRRVPEPASMALLGAGLLGLGFSRRRKF